LFYKRKSVRELSPAPGMNPPQMKVKTMYKKGNLHQINAILNFGISFYFRDLVFFGAGVLFARIYL
jgi:hypothetical protein